MPSDISFENRFARKRENDQARCHDEAALIRRRPSHVKLRGQLAEYDAYPVGGTNM